jgi:superfamily II helicase
MLQGLAEFEGQYQKIGTSVKRSALTACDLDAASSTPFDGYAMDVSWLSLREFVSAN